MDSSKQIAGGLTLLITAAVVVYLLIAKLAWNPMQPWPPQPDPYIALADEEFVEVVEIPEPMPIRGSDESAPAKTETDLDNDARLAPETGTALKNAGSKADAPAKIVTSDRPSTVKTQKKDQPKNAGPTVDNQKKKEEAIAKQTQNTAATAFGKTVNKNNANQGKEDKANTGRTSGKETSAGPSNSNGKKVGVGSGRVGGGWNMPNYSRSIQSNEIGTANFEVEVNVDGSVGKVRCTSSSGLSNETITNCIDEIRRHSFTYKGNRKAEPVTAYVTFRFEDPKK